MSATVLEHLRRTLYWRDYPKWLTRRRSNVDKQRRRLLADRLELKAYYATDRARPLRTQRDRYDEARRLDNWASKLRTIAARLRGTG